MKANFNLSKEERDEMCEQIQTYFEKERDETIGNLAAMMILDFVIEELAPRFYNIGVEDAHAFMSAKLDDLFEIEK